MKTTYRTMDVPDLGDNATATDLREFRTACRMRQAETGTDDSAVTDWVWNNGDWSGRVAAVLERNTR